jgi:phytanoyl-CoA hydroxylase
MKTTLTRQQIHRYHEDGCLVIKNFLGDHERQNLLDAIDTAVATMGKQKIAGSNARDFPEKDGFYDKVFLQRLNLWKISSFVHDMFTGNELGAMLCKLADVDALRIWHDQTLQKMPWANATAWHLDDPYWSFYSRQAITVWIALDDATIQNGCMHYLPGSHKLARFDNTDLDENMSGLFDIYPEFSHIEPLIGEMKAGDAGFHNGLTAHAAGSNMTPYPRRAMTCAYMPDGSVFNGQQNILSEQYLASLNVGDPLQDDEQNPLVGTAQ